MNNNSYLLFNSSNSSFRNTTNITENHEIVSLKIIALILLLLIPTSIIYFSSKIKCWFLK